MPQRVSVIATVYNEASSITGLLDSLARQTRPPDEVVIVDGGSTDGTLEMMQEYAVRGTLPLHILSCPGLNIAAGRNAAIAAAQGEIIASTDAGVRLEPDWLEHLVAPFAQDPAPDVVSGFFLADPQSTFEKALGAITLPRLGELDLAAFNPSSRSVAFRRAAWERVGGYPEWLDYCEDLVYDFALRDAGCVFSCAPAARVRFRPRPDLGAFFRQYYRYARGDGKAGLYALRHAIRYGTYLVALPLLVALAALHSPLWWLALGAGAVGLLRTPLARLGPWLRGAPLGEALAMLAWAPIIRVTGDVAKMAGYPVGVLWRRRGGAPGTRWSRRAF
jgi:glycosyltransferase involved in cell wall biosynthesis